MTCCFCDDIFKKNRELGLPIEDSIIYQDSNIYVMPDICPLAVGHLLIITKQHFQGFANAKEDVLYSVNKFLRYYEDKIGYRNYTIFEHGAVKPYTAGASVDHAHIHIIPFELRMHKLLKSSFPDWTQRNIDGLTQLARQKQPYLFYRLKSNKTGYVYHVGKMKSQFLREVAAQLIQRKKSYDWKEAYTSTEAYVDFYNTLAWWKSLSYPTTFKWQKKLILESNHLLSYRELLDEVHRFQMAEKETVVKILEKELEGNQGQYFRLVLVPENHQYKLPNYIVAKWEDLNGVENFLKQKGCFKEIWYFSGREEMKSLYKTAEEAYRHCFSGRVSYSWENHEWIEIIEMISGDDPRKLEKYSVETDRFDYLRASKSAKDSAYRIDSIYAGAYFKDVQEWMNCFVQFEKEVKKYYERLRRFRRVISRYGVYSLSLDFTMKECKLSFLDWDTSDDDKILRKYANPYQNSEEQEYGIFH